MLTGIARNDALGLSSVITIAHPRKTRWGFGIESHNVEEVWFAVVFG